MKKAKDELIIESVKLKYHSYFDDLEGLINSVKKELLLKGIIVSRIRLVNKDSTVVLDFFKSLTIEEMEQIAEEEKQALILKAQKASEASKKAWATRKIKLAEIEEKRKKMKEAADQIRAERKLKKDQAEAIFNAEKKQAEWNRKFLDEILKED